jgi:hypothetical protein
MRRYRLPILICLLAATTVWAFMHGKGSGAVMLALVLVFITMCVWALGVAYISILQAIIKGGTNLIRKASDLPPEEKPEEESTEESTYIAG